MKHNIGRILSLLEEGLEREKKVLAQRHLAFVSTDTSSREALAHQKGVVGGIEIAISWIENNISL